MLTQVRKDIMMQEKILTMKIKQGEDEQERREENNDKDEAAQIKKMNGRKNESIEAQKCWKSKKEK